jgi:PAS domain S-box-containing protein
MTTAAPRDRVLTWVLPLLPAVVALVLLVLSLMLAEIFVAKELSRRAGARVEQISQLYADQISRSLARRTAELQLIGEMARANIKTATWRDQMQRLKIGNSAYAWIGVSDENGLVEVASDGLLEGTSIASRRMFINGRDGLWFGSLHPPAMALSDPLLARGLPVPRELADIAMPVYDAQGLSRGVIAAHLDAAFFDQLRARLLGDEETRRALEVALVDADGRVLLGKRPEVSESEWRSLLAGQDEQSRTVPDDQGEPYFLSRAAIQPRDSELRTPWQVVGFQPRHAALAPAHLLERNLLVWGGITTLLLGVAGFAVSRYLARPYSQSEQHLREQGEVLAAVINSASDAVISVNTNGLITLFNPAAARIFGHPASHMIGQPLDMLLPKMQRSQHLGHLRRFADSQATTRPMGVGRVTGLRADGQTLDLEASISQITVRGNKVLTAILRDVSERVRAERAVAQYQLELSELTHRLLHQEKQTTRRLAQILHDQLGQTLGAIRLSFDAFTGMIPLGLPDKAKDRALKLGNMIDIANAEVRQVLVELRPPLLDEAGLQSALENEVHTRSKDAEPVALRLKVDPMAIEVRWPADVEYAAFMVAREALANAVMHANANEVVVRLNGETSWLHLQVSDDGKGLSPAMAAGRPGHLGIVGMRERALAIGARMEATSPPKGGTVITLTWGTLPAPSLGDTSPARP